MMDPRINKVREEALKHRGFEYDRCEEAGLNLETTYAIVWCSCGIANVVQHLIEQTPETADDVFGYVESIGCLNEDQEATASAIYDTLPRD